MCASLKIFGKFIPRGSVVMLFAVLLIGYGQVAVAQPSSQKSSGTTFRSTEEASHALFVAVETRDTRALTQILGQRTELVSSNDSAQDELDREQFVHKYQEMHRLSRERNGVVTLYIGAENWPFPIPLVSRDGVWRYDSDAGEMEVLYRRIGENEVTAIEVCHALVASVTKPQPPADADDPARALLAAAGADHKPVARRGYYFRVLPNSGNNTLTVVAYPAAYGSSGVMTFVVDEGDVVYQKDLGPSTPKVATARAAHHADSSWTPAETGLAEAPGAQ